MRNVYFVGGTKNFDENKTPGLSQGLVRELFPSSLGPRLHMLSPENRLRQTNLNSIGHRTTSPTKALLRAAAAQDRWENDAEQAPDPADEGEHAMGHSGR